MGDVKELGTGMRTLNLRSKQKEEGDKLLEKRNVQLGGLDFPKLAPGTPSNQQVKVRSNLFNMKMHQSTKLYQYHVEVAAVFIPRDAPENVERRSILSNVSKDDAHSITQGYKCINVFRYTWNYAKNHGQNIPDIEKCYYDLRNILYTTEEIPMNQDGYLILSGLNENDGNFPLFGSVKCGEISLRSTSKTIRLGEIPVQSGTFQDDKSIQTCLDIITSQGIFFNLEEYAAYDNGASYPLNPGRYGFKHTDCPPINDGAFISVGAMKSTKIIQGKNGLQAVLMIATKKTPFYQTEFLHERILRNFPDLLKGAQVNTATMLATIHHLTVVPSHLPNSARRSFPIKKLSAANSLDSKFEKDGVTISVFDYFKAKYNITLQHPKLPVIVTEGKDDRQCFYPLEVLQIADNQRVKHGKLSRLQVADIIKVAAAAPRIVNEQLPKAAASLDLFNKRTVEAGVEVFTHSIETIGNVLPPPKFVYNNKQISRMDETKFTWRAGRPYLIPADIKVWAIYAYEMEPKFDAKDLRTFAQGFHKQCTNRGMTIEPPADMKCLDRNAKFEHLETIFRKAHEERCQYIIFITTKSDKPPHRDFKSLEQKYGIVTQNITTDVAASAVGLGGPVKVQTMENLVNKANMKNGGVNYGIFESSNKLLGEDDLFIGVAVSQPSAAERMQGPHVPAVVGYAANDTEQPCAFTGDYKFQEAEPMEKFRLIESIVKTVLKRYNRNRGKNPKRVFLLRNHVADSQYEMVKRYEIPLVKKILESYSAAELVYIVPNKMHNVKLYPVPITGNSDLEQNLRPGTFIDTDIVSPGVSEFYLIGHAARKGTAKVPRYTVLQNDANCTSDEMYKLVFYLCHGHQIINGATGLPSPVFIANRYAERGRLNYNTYVTSQNGNTVIPLAVEGDSGSSSGDSTGNDDIYRQLDEKLSYLKSNLRNVRFNA